MKKNKPFVQCNFLIVGLVRNCERTIEKNIKVIHNAFKKAKKVNWLIIESDSDDLTKEKLNLISHKYSLKILNLGELRFKYPLRTQRIAYCRNQYVDKIRYDPMYKEVDYVVVADLDGVNHLINSQSVQKCWKVSVQWDACFANQSSYYYDIWALRHSLWSPNDCFKQHKDLVEEGFDPFYSKQISLYSRMIKIPQNAKPIKVTSAFGGLGIYKKELFEHSEYCGLDKNGDEVCEHVLFHEKFIKTKNLFIFPFLINSKHSEHTKERKPAIQFFIFLISRFFSFEKLKRLYYLFK